MTTTVSRVIPSYLAEVVLQDWKPEGGGVSDYVIDLSSPDGLRDSVRVFRAQETTNTERGSIRHAWVEAGIPNQFAAMFRAADLEKAIEMRQ